VLLYRVNKNKRIKKIIIKDPFFRFQRQKSKNIYVYLFKKIKRQLERILKHHVTSDSSCLVFRLYKGTAGRHGRGKWMPIEATVTGTEQRVFT